MEMSRQEAEDMVWVLSTVLGHHLVVAAIREAGAGDKVFAAAKRLETCLSDHWKRTGDSFDNPSQMSAELRKRERYRDLLDARPASMLEPVTFADDDESGLRRVPMRPVDEAEDTW